jgi:hypothetical protein
MTTNDDNAENTEHKKYGGMLPFIVVFGGLIAICIIAKLLINFFM